MVGTMGRVAHAQELFGWVSVNTQHIVGPGGGYLNVPSLFATSIAVTNDNVPYITDTYIGAVFFLHADWGIWYAQGYLGEAGGKGSVGVTPDNHVFNIDYEQEEAWVSQAWIGPSSPISAAPPTSAGPTPCITSMAQNWYQEAGGPSAYVVLGCDYDAFGNSSIWFNGYQNSAGCGLFNLFHGTPNGSCSQSITLNAYGATQFWTPLPGVGRQLAVFMAPAGNLSEDWAMGSLWVTNAEGGVYAYSVNQGEFVQQPGSGVSAITDHWVVGGDGALYFWDDYAPSPLPGQLVAGNWEGPMLGPLPTGASIVQLAYSAYGTAPTSVWAIDSDGQVWQTSSCPDFPYVTDCNY
jgi:hypothetical protein